MKGAMLQVILQLGCVFMVAIASIEEFDTSDVVTAHYHSQTETLFAYQGKGTNRPFIDFHVNCPVKASTVSYIVVQADSSAIKKWNRQGTQFISARCKTALPLKCSSGLPDSDDATKTQTTTEATTSPSSKASTSKPSGETTSTSDYDEDYYSSEEPDEGGNRRRDADDSTTTIASTSSSSLDWALCDEKSGIYFDRSAHVVASGCIACEKAIGHGYEKIYPQSFNQSGYYTLWIESQPGINDGPGTPINGTSSFKNLQGYLPAELVPLQKLYAGLGVCYLLIGLVWLVYLGMFYQDLLKLQIWIGAVIALGMFEMGISFGDLNYLNENGIRSDFLMTFSKLLFALKNTLARLLILIVSLGFGIVKPSLGSASKQILLMGIAYFVFSAAYGVAHAYAQTDKSESKTEMIVIIPLSLLDAAMFWWIFLALSRTMKMLALRNNKIKLSIYAKFQWALIVSVIATVIFALWSIYDRFSVPPDQDLDWENSWWQDGYWHILFFIILMVIMFLWRPTKNNQRYAYSALEGEELEEDDEYNKVVPNFQNDAMKMRTLSSRGHQPPDEDDDEDLRWVEENIPSTVVGNDSSFPTFPMDSDEEELHTRFEMSKMD